MRPLETSPALLLLSLCSLMPKNQNSLDSEAWRITAPSSGPQASHTQSFSLLRCLDIHPEGDLWDWIRSMPLKQVMSSPRTNVRGAVFRLNEKMHSFKALRIGPGASLMLLRLLGYYSWGFITSPLVTIPMNL